MRWRRTEREEKASEELKSRLTQTPILDEPDMDPADETNPINIFTDAYASSTGAVLCQHGRDGFLFAIYCASNKLSKAKKNWYNGLEALIIKFAVNL